MKIRMTKSYRVYEVYDTIEINKEDYPELEGMTDEEALEYLNENMYEFEIKDGYEGSLVDEFEFNKDIIKDDLFDEDYDLFLVKFDEDYELFLVKE
jgi:hypothetical protein